MFKTELRTAVFLAGLTQIAIAASSLAIPRLLHWREETAGLVPLTRQVFWTYAGYIFATNLAFGSPPMVFDRSRSARCCSWRRRPRLRTSDGSPPHGHRLAADRPAISFHSCTPRTDRRRPFAMSSSSGRATRPRSPRRFFRTAAPTSSSTSIRKRRSSSAR